MAPEPPKLLQTMLAERRTRVETDFQSSQRFRRFLLSINFHYPAYTSKRVFAPMVNTCTSI